MIPIYEYESRLSPPHHLFTLLKINVEPENQHLEETTHLPSTIMFGKTSH